MSDYLKDRITATNERVKEGIAAKKKADEDAATKATEEAEKKKSNNTALDLKWDADIILISSIAQAIQESGISYIENIIIQGNAAEKIRPIVFLSTSPNQKHYLQVVLEKAQSKIKFQSPGRTFKPWSPVSIGLLDATREDYERIIMDYIDVLEPT